MAAMLRRALLGLLLAGCCRDAGACPQNAVVVRVSADGAPVEGVAVEGAATSWRCSDLDLETICQPESIADGDYVVLVTTPGAAPIEVVIIARTFEAPPYSCDCEVPTGEASLEVAPAEVTDAGAQQDAAATSDGG